jgi:hypothetical protein
MAKIVQGQHGRGVVNPRVLAFNPAFVVKSPVMLRLRASLKIVREVSRDGGQQPR